jgi:hypothetical protein
MPFPLFRYDYGDFFAFFFAILGLYVPRYIPIPLLKLAECGLGVLPPKRA